MLESVPVNARTVLVGREGVAVSAYVFRELAALVLDGEALPAHVPVHLEALGLPGSFWPGFEDGAVQRDLWAGWPTHCPRRSVHAVAWPA